MFDIVKKGSTDRSVTVTVLDSTAGTPETGVAYNTAGIDLWYRRDGATKTSITEATLAGVDAAHSDGGFIHIADGVCRLDLPDAAFATGANYVDFGGTITGMVVIGGRVRLVDFDLETALQGVNVTQISGDSTAADNLELMFDGTGYAGGTTKLDVNTVTIEGADATDTVNAQCDTALSDVGLTTTVTGRIDAAISTRSTLAAGAAMTLTSGERTALAAALEAAIIDELDGAAVMQAIADLIASDMTTGDLSVVAIATAVRDAILNRVLASNHDTSGTPGALLQAIATRATQASVDGVDTKAADLQAQVGTAGAGLTALRGAGTDTLESLATAVAGVSAGSAPTVEEIDAELTANHGAGLWTSAVTGSGDVYVTAATLDDDGDTMEFETSSGAGIGGASVKAFVKAEYDAGTFTVRGITTTADDGTWTDALLLNDGVQYTIEFSKDGYDTTTTTVTPSA